MLRVGINPYGLTCTVGLQGSSAGGIDQLLRIAEDVGAAAIELHSAWLARYSDREFARLRERLARSAMAVVISLGPPRRTQGLPRAQEISGILPEVTASLEPGALEARHIRLLNREWWDGCAPPDTLELIACLKAARRRTLPEDADCRTPWEAGAPPEAVLDYEIRMLSRSVDNRKAWGWMS